MAKLDEETRDEIITRAARLIAAIAKAVEPLISSSEQSPGQFGGEIHLPTRRQIASGLASDADALLALLPKDTRFE
jgi:hypothetical protein